MSEIMVVIIGVLFVVFLILGMCALCAAIVGDFVVVSIVVWPLLIITAIYVACVLFSIFG